MPLILPLLLLVFQLGSIIGTRQLRETHPDLARDLNLLNGLIHLFVLYVLFRSLFP